MLDKASKDLKIDPGKVETLLKIQFQLVQAFKIHRHDNALVLKGAREFNRMADLLNQEAPMLHIRFLHHRIFIEGEKLAYRRNSARQLNRIYEWFESLGVQELRFDLQEYLASETPDFAKAMSLVRILAEAQQQAVSGDRINDRLKAAGIFWVRTDHRIEAALSDHSPEKREQVRQTYAYALHSVREVVEKLSGRSRVGVHRIIRITQNMVDVIMADDPLFMVLSTLRDHDDYTCRHSVNVAILAMYLGKRIDLPKNALERLGICGLLHDLGKLEVPLPILNKPGKLTPEEFEVMKRHSLDSARLILKLRASRDRRSQLILPPLEHHQKYDLSGYPQSNRKKRLSLFGRILSIADVYDAVTSPRVYRKTVLSPDRALGKMVEGMGTEFDPILLKVFFNMLGAYPVGTLLLLEDGTLGLAMGMPSGADKERPWMQQLVPDGKRGFRKGPKLDLGAKDPDTGHYLNTIVHTFHPSTFGIQPAEYLL